MAHAGVHVDPEVWLAVQLPTVPPTEGNKESKVQSHALAVHVGALLLKFPLAHTMDPEDVYPALHVILQDAPLVKVAVQLSIPPFGIVGVAHGLALHTGAVV